MLLHEAAVVPTPRLEPFRIFKTTFHSRNRRKLRIDMANQVLKTAGDCEHYPKHSKGHVKVEGNMEINSQQEIW